MNKRFYITTAIDYVNGHVHLGHACEKVVTDVVQEIEGLERQRRTENRQKGSRS